MKYVAFIDILGFKKKLEKLNQIEAQQYIANFSRTIYNIWNEEDSYILNGYIVSDSLIIYTNNTTKESLTALNNTIIKIAKAEFSENSITIRGAIAKGSFDKLEVKELSNLSKGLIVGQAYIDAYTLESSVKTLGIVLSKDVYEDICNICDCNYLITQENDNYILSYLDIDFFLEEKNLKSFVSMAVNAKWLPHYYNTLYYALNGVKNENKVNQMFFNIINLIKNNSASENWRNIDMFIENTFNTNVNHNYKTRFLKFIRNKL